MGILSAEKKGFLIPKSSPGPESSLKEFPLLYLYFDNFLEVQNAAKEGAIDIGMLRSFEGLGDYRFRGILSDERRFLEFYKDNAIRIKLKDGTTLDRKKETKYWDQVIHPEKYVREPVDFSKLDSLQKRMAELLANSYEEINSLIKTIKHRYGI